MLKMVVTVMGAALLLNANVASAAKRSFEQQRGFNAFFGATQQSADGCKSWTVSSGLSETSMKTEPGAAEVSGSAFVSLSISDECNHTFTDVFLNVGDVAKFKGNLTGAALDLDVPVTVTSCDSEFVCTESTGQLVVSLSWSSTGNPERSKQHIVNLAPDGVRSSIHITGTGRDSTTTGSISLNGQTYALTADNVHTSSLTTDAKMFVVFTSK